MTKRREFIGRLIVAGPTRTVTGEAGGLVVTAEAIREAIDAGLFRGLACFADHATVGASSVRRLLGVWQAVEWDEAAGAAVGRLATYETDGTRPVLELLEQWLGEEAREGAGERPDVGVERPDVGVSLVFYPRLAADGRTVAGIVMVESADVVMFPASAGSRIVGRVTNDELRTTNEEVRGAGEGEGYGAAARSVAFGLWGAGEEGESADYANLREETGGGALASHSLFQNTLSGTMEPDLMANDPGVARGIDSHSQSLVASCPSAALHHWMTANSQSTKEQHSPTISLSSIGLTGTGSGAAVPFVGDVAADAPGRAMRAAGPAINQLSTQSNRQEYEQMKQQTEGTIAPRVALVRGNDGRQPTDDRGHEANGGREADGWLDALRTAAAEAVIRASGLPGPVQERLGAGRYETAEDVYTAVERARAELAALSEAGVVRLGGRPGASPMGSPAIRLGDGLDEARELVGFFFGAAGAPTPPANMRSFADLYVALTGDVHFRGVFDGGRVLFSGATTATLPNLAVDAMNRVIAEQFAALEHYRWYERVTDVAPNDGRLHAMKWLTLGGIGNLPTVSEGAAYTELSVADAKETASFVKRGGYVGITREMIKNGDLMQMQAIPRALAAAAVRTRSAAVGAIFTANAGVGPTLAQDSKALFHADHGNLATTALGADATAWRAARSECFQQVELGSSKPLGIFPRFLLVPAELYDTALSILGYGEGMPTTYTPEAQSRGFADPRPIPLVVPDWTDATDWAYIVDPALFPVIQMSYSQAPGGRSHPIPELFAVVSETSGLMFSNDVLPIKVRDEFAVGVNGPRGIGKRNVA